MAGPAGRAQGRDSGDGQGGGREGRKPMTTPATISHEQERDPESHRSRYYPRHKQETPQREQSRYSVIFLSRKVTCGRRPMPRRRHGDHLHLHPALRGLHLHHGRQARLENSAPVQSIDDTEADTSTAGRPVVGPTPGRTREAGQGRTHSRQATRQPPRPPPSTLRLWLTPMQVILEMRFEHVDSRYKSDLELSKRWSKDCA